MIVLDGNREHLCEPNLREGRPAGCEVEWQAQIKWLREQLRDVDDSATERGAILFVHQSPYTRSPWVEDDQGDARAFAEVLLESKRGLALLSAHAHGYERYRFKLDPLTPDPPKYFIVTAGGGGPRPPEPRLGAPCDESSLPWPRPFNYLLLRQTGSGVDVTVRGLEKSAPAVQELADEHQVFAFP